MIIDIKEPPHSFQCEPAALALVATGAISPAQKIALKASLGSCKEPHQIDFAFHYIYSLVYQTVSRIAASNNTLLEREKNPYFYESIGRFALGAAELNNGFFALAIDLLKNSLVHGIPAFAYEGRTITMEAKKAVARSVMDCPAVTKEQGMILVDALSGADKFIAKPRRRSGTSKAAGGALADPAATLEEQMHRARANMFRDELHADIQPATAIKNSSRI